MVVGIRLHSNIRVTGLSESASFGVLFCFNAAKDLFKRETHFFGHYVVQNGVEGGGKIVADPGDKVHPVIDFLN